MKNLVKCVKPKEINIFAVQRCFFTFCGALSGTSVDLLDKAHGWDESSTYTRRKAGNYSY